MGRGQDDRARCLDVVPVEWCGGVKYRLLGRTGLNVSALSLGTVSLGTDYGIAAPGQFQRPDEDSAIHLMRRAVDCGVTLVDTAPGYGESERLVGRALGSNADVIVATKVTAPVGPDVQSAIDASLASSRRALERDRLDIVQIHNATADLVAKGDITAALVRAKARGEIGFLGASVYGEEAALAVVASGEFDVLQVALSVLDQRMAARVLPAAQAAGVGIIIRSALLKGALTSKAQWLPDGLERLRTAAEQARNLLAGGSWEALPRFATRFCLSFPSTSSVLVGARTRFELDLALESEQEGPLAADVLDSAAHLGLEEERLLNPSNWPAA